MAVYAIGDIQGCLDSLLKLLKKVGFDPRNDRLWFAGDLVNRGPDSLETLRYIKSLGAAATTVLGNHDLHLLAAAYHPTRKHKRDTLHEILTAPDREELLHWLRHQPLLHHDPELGYTMVHAGLPPQWDLALAQECAEELHTALQGEDCITFFAHMYGDTPDVWHEDLQGWERLRFITNCFTRLRYCDEQGHLALQEKGPPGSQPPPYHPWFSLEHRASAGLKVIFGHWSTLKQAHYPGVFPLDTGCLWGGELRPTP